MRCATSLIARRVRPQAAQQLRLHLEQEVGDGEQHVEEERVLLRLQREVHLRPRARPEGAAIHSVVEFEPRHLIAQEVRAAA